MNASSLFFVLWYNERTKNEKQERVVYLILICEKRKMKKYILSIDQGTTSTRAILFNQKCEQIAVAQMEIKQYFPQPGWVEQDANEIWLSVLTVISDVLQMSKVSPKDIESVGITNQRETTVLWNKYTGLPVHKAIVWQSRQSSELCHAWKMQGYEKLVREKTGLPIDAYFSASKIRWMMDELEGLEDEMKQGNILFGTIDTWILWKLTGGVVHATDFTNASRTMMYNIFEKCWDDELLTIFEIPKNILPEVKKSSSHFGNSDIYHFFGEQIPIQGIAGDQQAALFGQLCWDKGEVKNTYGTGCFLLMNLGDEAIISKKGLITTLACNANGDVCYALEGSVFVAGSAIQWLRDGLRIIDHAKDSELFATSVEDSAGVYVVPAFVGLGAPYWDADARGTMFGLTRGTTKQHIVRATLESIAYQSKDVIVAMEEEANKQINVLKVDGGATENAFLMQFQAEILQGNVECPSVKETTALGVALLAGLYSGFYHAEQVKADLSKDKILYRPTMKTEEAEKKYRGWKKAVKATMSFHENS